ncbi:MAG: hypothetical protein GC129_06355 [Proteobacteria bacterium]|nr:hypothetical protein [Pseudomonadota bacterium]
MLTRRTLLATSTAAAVGAILPSAAFANDCGQTPRSLADKLALLDQLAPSSATVTQVRNRYYTAMIDFSYTHMVALEGQSDEPAYHLRNEADRATFLKKVFAKSTFMLNAAKDLAAELKASAAKGSAIELITLQVQVCEDSYATQYRQMSQALALLDDPLVARDSVLTEASKSLRQAIATVGNGNAARAMQLAWEASPHIAPMHFRHFLPVVSPSGDLVTRMAQLKQGAEVITAGA